MCKYQMSAINLMLPIQSMQNTMRGLERLTEMSLLFLIISSKLKCVSFECLIHSNDQRQNNYFDMDHLNVSQILLGLNFVCYNSLNRVRCTCA